MTAMVVPLLENPSSTNSESENNQVSENSTTLSLESLVVIQACEMYTCSGFGALAKVCVRCDEHQVVLSGELPSYRLKQLAQELIRPILDHRNLDNRCSVIDRVD